MKKRREYGIKYKGSYLTLLLVICMLQGAVSDNRDVFAGDVTQAVDNKEEATEKSTEQSEESTSENTGISEEYDRSDAMIETEEIDTEQIAAEQTTIEPIGTEQITSERIDTEQELTAGIENTDTEKNGMENSAKEENVVEETEVLSEEPILSENTLDQELQEEVFPYYEEQIMNPAFVLSASADTSRIKAGQPLVYHISVENTGNVSLNHMIFAPVFSGWEDKISGTWETAVGASVEEQENMLLLEMLEAGETREFYYTAELPEEMEGTLECKVKAIAQYTTKDIETPGELIREQKILTEIQPLTADFTVKKTADRKMAAAGDTIYYQICISNTGERILHSVLTTERFQLEGIHVEFVEKEGVLLNADKTQALISKIEPGKTVGLQAAVTLPDNVVSGELLNHVTVVTKETGVKSAEASASVQVYGREAVITEIPETENIIEETEPAALSQAEPVKVSPKTSDESQISLWTGIFTASLMSLGAVYRRLKAKTKH